MGCFGQLIGMGYSIYFVWDWNDVEPWTWMFCKYKFVNNFRIILLNGWLFLVHEI